jgi:hypothetical protein
MHRKRLTLKGAATDSIIFMFLARLHWSAFEEPVLKRLLAGA